jgi:hypothetical protein
MNEFMRLNDEANANKGSRRITSNPLRVTSERIEKLKKTFQPFWMREMGLHPYENRRESDLPNMLNQI